MAGLQAHAIRLMRVLFGLRGDPEDFLVSEHAFACVPSCVVSIYEVAVALWLGERMFERRSRVWY